MNFRAFRPHFALRFCLWLFGAWAVFVLPWKLPPSRRIDSDSYAVGFNNGVALLGLGFTLAALFLCHLRWPLLRDKRWHKQLHKLWHPFPVSHSEYLLPVMLALVQCIAMWIWYRMIPTANYGEMGYTVSRVELILLGKVPYQDFEWNYGPLFLYLPALLVRFSQYRLSSDQAYMVSLVIFTFASLVAVYYVLSQLRLHRAQRFAIFLLVCSSFNLGLGANGTPTRFIVPYAALFFIYRQTSQRDLGDWRSRMALYALMAGAVMLCFLISPETGVVFLLGLCLFCAVHIRHGHRWSWTAIVVAPLVGLMPILAFSGAYGRSMASFGGGAANFPVVPSGSILFYLVSIALIVPLLGLYAWRNLHPQSALVLALTGMITLFSAPALGRCDVGHVFYNGMGLFIFGLALFFRFRSRMPFYPVLFFLFFTLSYPFSYFFHYAPIVSSILRQHSQGIVKGNRNFFQTSFHNRNPQVQRLQLDLSKFPRIGVPLGVDEAVEIMLKYQSKYIPEYYPCPSLEVRTGAQLQHKLEDVGKMPIILVEAQKLVVKPFNSVFYAHNQQKFVSQVVLYPLSYSLKHEPLFPEREIVLFINSHFEKTETFGSYVLLKNRSNQ